MSDTIKRIIVIVATVVCLAITGIVSVAGYQKAAGWYHDRFTFPANLEPVDYSKDRNTAQCLDRRTPQRLKDLCRDAFKKK